MGDSTTHDQYLTGRKDSKFHARVKFVGSEDQTIAFFGVVNHVPRSPINPLETESAGPGQQKWNLEIYDEPPMEAYIRLAVASTFTDSRDRQKTTRIGVTFDAHNIVGTITAKEVPLEDISTEFGIAWGLNEEAVAELCARLGASVTNTYKPQIWDVALTYSSSKLQAYNLLNDVFHNEGQPVIESLRRALKSCVKVHFLVNSNKTGHEIDTLNLRLNEIRESDPFLKFWTNGKIPAQIQLGQGLEDAENWPQIQRQPAELPRKLNFANFEHYVTIFHVAIVATLEIVKNQSKKFAAKVALFHLQKPINDTYDHATEFWGYLEVPEEKSQTLRLVKDDTLKLHFALEGEDEDEDEPSSEYDLYAVVTEYTPYIDATVVPIRVNRRWQSSKDQQQNHPQVTSAVSDVKLFHHVAVKGTNEGFAQTRLRKDFPHGAIVIPTSGESLLRGLRAIVASWKAQLSHIEPHPTVEALQKLVHSDEVKKAWMSHSSITVADEKGVETTESGWDPNFFSHDQMYSLVSFFCDQNDMEDDHFPDMGFVGDEHKPTLLRTGNVDSRYVLWIHYYRNHYEGLRKHIPSEKELIASESAKPAETHQGPKGDYLDPPFDLKEDVGDLTGIPSVDEARQYIMKEAKLLNVTVKVLGSDKPLRRNVNSLSRLNSMHRHDGPQPWPKVLLGNELDKQDVRDFFEAMGDLTDSILKVTHSGHLNAQVMATAMTRHAPYGISLVGGCGGTGKSKWAVDMAVSYVVLRHGSIHSSPRPKFKKGNAHTIVIVAPSNAIFEVLYELTTTRCRQVVGGKSAPIIIRYLPWDTEQDRFKYEANLGLPPRRPTRKLPGMDEELNAAHADIIQLVEASSHRPFAGINDIRLKSLRATLGFWMLVCLDVVEFNNPLYDNFELKDSVRYLEVSNEYRKYCRGEKFDFEEKTRFTELMNSLRDEVVREADVVITTVSNLADPALYKGLNPFAFIADEAGRMLEPDIISMFAWYPTARHFILMGDSKQLSPFVSRDQELDNIFAQQLELSLFTRLELLGYPIVYFIYSHRAHIAILMNISWPIYRGALLASKTTLNRAEVKQLESVMRDIYGKGSSALVFNIDTRSIRQINSTKNPESAMIVCQWIISVLQRNILPTDIAILVPYVAQRMQYINLLWALHKCAPEMGFDRIRVGTFDSFQGSEAPITLVDLVVTSSLGFLRDSRRINVAFTRARNGLFVFANKTTMEGTPHYDQTQIDRILTSFQNNGNLMTLDTGAEVQKYKAFFDNPAPSWLTQTAGDDAEQLEESTEIDTATSAFGHSAAGFQPDTEGFQPDTDGQELPITNPSSNQDEDNASLAANLAQSAELVTSDVGDTEVEAVDFIAEALESAQHTLEVTDDNNALVQAPNVESTSLPETGVTSNTSTGLAAWQSFSEANSP